MKIKKSTSLWHHHPGEYKQLVTLQRWQVNCWLLWKGWGRILGNTAQGLVKDRTFCEHSLFMKTFKPNVSEVKYGK